MTSWAEGGGQHAYELDLHVHTRHSFDGLVSPGKVCKKARELGLDGVAIADHGTIRGGVEAWEAAHSSDFVVVVGMEVATEIGDIVGLFLRSPLVSKWSQDCVAEVHQQGGLAILPHPCRHHLHLSRQLLEALDGVEVWNARDRRDVSHIAREQLATPYSLAELGGSDAHWSREIGRARTIVSCPSLSAENVKTAIEARRTVALCCARLTPGIEILATKSVKHSRRAYNRVAR